MKRFVCSICATLLLSVGVFAQEAQIEKLTTEQLKALAYDQMLILTQAQQNLQVINAELQKRAEQQKEKKDKK